MTTSKEEASNNSKPKNVKEEVKVDVIKLKDKASTKVQFAVMSGWISGGTQVIYDFQLDIALRVRKQHASKEFHRVPSVKAMAYLINNDAVVGGLVTKMLMQFRNILDRGGFNFKHMATVDQFLDGINVIIQRPPPFFGKHLIGVPLAAWFTGVDATLAGVSLFRMPVWNDALYGILKSWGIFLDNKDSNTGFRNKEEGWISPAAMAEWLPDLWAKDNPDIPWYNSWNSFFTRQFLDRFGERPVNANPASISSTNDGALFRWRMGIKETDVFWFKDMAYSLSDIFSSSNSSQQKILDDLPAKFVGGAIFQSFLNPFNFHRWWAPVSGSVVFDPMVIRNCYYSKLALPDFDGSTTNSLPYLLEMNCRGICVLDTTGKANIGYVCCVPIGMVEVSSIKFGVKKGDEVNKGDELGYFQFGGSSFAILFEDAEKYQKLIRFAAERVVYNGSSVFPRDAPLPTPTGGGEQIDILVGEQIATISTITS